MAISGLAAGELRPTDLSSPSRFSGVFITYAYICARLTSVISGRLSGADFFGGTPQYSFSPLDPCSQGAEPTSDNPVIVPTTGNPAAYADPIGKLSSFQLYSILVRGTKGIAHTHPPFFYSSRPEAIPRRHHALGNRLYSSITTATRTSGWKTPGFGYPRRYGTRDITARCIAAASAALDERDSRGNP